MKNLENYNIIVIGDSVTKGVYLKKGKEIQKTDKTAVEILNEIYNCEINNFSVFGQSLKRIYEKGLHTSCVDKYYNKDKNNIVVISLGGNDADYDWAEVAKSPKSTHTDKTPLSEFNEYLQKTIDDLKEKKVEIIFTALFPISSERYYKNVIKKKYDGKKIKAFLNGDLTNIHRHQDSFNMAIMHTAIKNHLKFLDFRTPLLQKINFLDYLSDDGIHPNENGQQALAQIASEFIENYQSPKKQTLKTI